MTEWQQEQARGMSRWASVLPFPTTRITRIRTTAAIVARGGGRGRGRGRGRVTDRARGKGRIRGRGRGKGRGRGRGRASTGKVKEASQ